MQITKAYSGTVTLGSTASRVMSFGGTAIVTVYPNKVDFLNQTVADFLKNNCGADVAYEARHGSVDKFLWIFGAPFLLGNASSSTNSTFYGPLDDTALPGSVKLFSASKSGDYQFSIIFTGNPQNGFALRFKTYGSTGISDIFWKVIRAKNILNDKNAVVFGPSAASANGVDLNADGTPDAGSFSVDTVEYTHNLQGKAITNQNNPSKFPLVPMIFNTWLPDGFYLRPSNFGLPETFDRTVETQAEVEIGGRRFILTSTDATGTEFSPMRMGMIEV